MRIAIIGSGISGLSAAHYLERLGHEITVYEKAAYFGGHAAGLDVEFRDGQQAVTVPVNPAFDIFNKVSYPRYIALLDELGLAYEPCEFSYTYICLERDASAIAWQAMLPVFLKWRNLLQLFSVPHFFRLALISSRVGRKARQFMRAPVPGVSFVDFLRQAQVPEAAIDGFFIPVFARPWGMKPEDMRNMPAEVVLKWADEHRVLTPWPVQWYKNSGGATSYIRKLVEVLSARGVKLHANMPVCAAERLGESVQLRFANGDVAGFDQVVMATSAVHAMEILGNPAAEVMDILGVFRYQTNHVAVHSDTRLLPENNTRWSYFNVCYNPASNDTYNNIWFGQKYGVPVFATNYRQLPFALDPGKVYSHYTFHQPIYEQGSVDAQAMLSRIQGVQGIWYCGIYCHGYGHHEDGLQSAYNVAEKIHQQYAAAA